MRIDVFLVQNGYVSSRQKAKNYIDQGLILINGKKISKPSETIDGSTSHSVEILAEDRYVGRGGIKLEGALNTFGVDVTKKRCIDIGASTGGFTDCLLQYGAESVCAIDSGKNQLHDKLKSDPRVVSYEGVNARSVTVDQLGGIAFELAVMDVSFISQTLIIPSIANGLLVSGGYFVSLIKPQFEAGRQALGKNGIVKKMSDRQAAVRRVIESAAAHGFRLEDIIESSILGGDGNTEYLACFKFEGKDALIDPEETKKKSDKLFTKR